MKHGQDHSQLGTQIASLFVARKDLTSPNTGLLVPWAEWLSMGLRPYLLTGQRQECLHRETDGKF